MTGWIILAVMIGAPIAVILFLHSLPDIGSMEEDF